MSRTATSSTPMTKPDLIALAERVEAATGPDRDLFIMAYQAVFPDGYSQDKSGYNYDRWVRFLELLDAKAWLDVAMTLVPDSPTEVFARLLQDTTDGKSWCELTSRSCHVTGEAATFALALTAAALRARAAITALEGGPRP